MPPKPWKTLPSRLIYENPWTRGREDIAEMPDGKTTVYGVIESGQAVGVLPFLEVAVFPFKQVFQMVLESEIRDAMTIVGVALCSSYDGGVTGRL